MRNRCAMAADRQVAAARRAGPDTRPDRSATHTWSLWKPKHWACKVISVPEIAGPPSWRVTEVISVLEIAWVPSWPVELGGTIPEIDPSVNLTLLRFAFLPIYVPGNSAR
jgi:hypothetical protein